MTKRIVALLLLAALAMTLFAACGKTADKKKDITEAEATQIALQAIGKTADQVDDVHVHKTTYQGNAVFQVHIHAGTEEYAVYIDQTGKVLNKIGG